MGEVYLLAQADLLASISIREPDIIQTGRYLKSNQVKYPRFFVYAWKRDGDFLYVGKTGSGLDRFGRSHRIISKARRRETDTIEIWICKGYEEIDELEIKLIKAFKPKFNIMHNSEGKRIKKPGRKKKEIYIPADLLMRCSSNKELKQIEKQLSQK